MQIPRSHLQVFWLSESLFHFPLFSCTKLGAIDLTEL